MKELEMTTALKISEKKSETSVTKTEYIDKEYEKIYVGLKQNILITNKSHKTKISIFNRL